MGSGNSILAAAQRHLSSEFNRLRKGRDYLVLSDLRKIQPMESMPLDLTHLGTIFVLDQDRDGRISLQDMMNFAALCTSKGKTFQPHEFQLQGHCTLIMYDTLVASGVEAFVRWFSRLFGEDGPTTTFQEYPGVVFLGRDAAHILHELLQIDENYGYDMQGFLDLMQRTGEEMGIMSLHDERLDDLVPVVVVDKFARSFGEGVVTLLRSLHFPHDTPPPPADDM